MNLVSNWSVVLRHAWSIRLLILAALLSGIEVALAVIGPPDWMPHGVFAAIAGLVTAAALVSRIVAQPKTLGDS